MKFISDDFLLVNDTAKMLFHEYAQKMGIIDYHCHLNIEDIAKDRKFSNITELWIEGDHYKWRLMRSCGIEEKYITGDGTPKEKFLMWARTLELCIGNPVYQWCMLELARYFDYEGTLDSSNAEEVWSYCNIKIKEKNMSARSIINESNVHYICTTDSPEDDLKWHNAIESEDSGLSAKVYPAFRPDKAIGIEKEEYCKYLKLLEKRFDCTIGTYKELIDTLRKSIEYFDTMGCKTSDHGINIVPFRIVTDETLEGIFKKRLNGSFLNEDEVEAYQTRILIDLGKEYYKRDWVMQIHYGAVRNNNEKMFNKLGPDTGFDSISAASNVQNLPLLLDNLNSQNILPKTIIYSLNPSDNAFLDTLCGCFFQENVNCKVQHGAAWWFNDNKKGMEEHLEGFANNNVLGNFVGMLTDSRSFLSYTRHEYFRRVLCNLLGKWVEEGQYPKDFDLLKKIIERISYYNALEFFGFQEDRRCDKNENDI